MKNITLSAQEDLISQARKYAGTDGTSLNDLFRKMLADYVSHKEAKERQRRLKAFHATLAEGPLFTSDRKFTREEMNER